MITEYKDICLICGRPKNETHHLVYGRGMREIADDDGLTVALCSNCHKEIHANGVAGKLSKIVGQLAFEIDRVEQGTPQAIARREFRKKYDRSYL